ncbi:10548_t:CDS:10 [Acaulospora morrowiae]|uniref:site-specific DNA-methyltransferase (adenine-specific) n=1 Tax=Acaulospora morrowiae TaxID=94023 RepID=A0A9N8ZZU0_9GLOM|nr:10548_t:CDS:10 [Acaulospora morrowiae]
MLTLFEFAIALCQTYSSKKTLNTTSPAASTSGNTTVEDGPEYAQNGGLLGLFQNNNAMPNASKSLDDSVQVLVPQPKRARTKQGDDDVNTTTDWLKVVLNEQEVDPSSETCDYYFQPPSSLSQQKAPTNSDAAFATPFVFKSVNPARNLLTPGESPYPPRRQDSCFTSSFSANVLSEDLVGKVVEVLGTVVEEIKGDIRRTFVFQNKGKVMQQFSFTLERNNTKPEGKDVQRMFFFSCVCVYAAYDWEFNKLVNETSFPLPANKPQPLKTVDHLRTILSAPNSANSLAHEAEIYRHTFDFYCQITAFLTVVQIFFESVVMDFLCEREEDLRMRRMSIDRFMNIFHDDDNFFQPPRPSNNDSELNNNNENLDAFNWYYHGVVRPQPQYYYDLSVRLRSFSVNFSTLETVESILSMFYTKHFLNVFAKEHQKDHGQFYTPREVMRFMWDRVLLGNALVEKLGGGSIQSTSNFPSFSTHPSSNASSWESLPQSPKVLDPCMGIGSFLCEFINRLTLAAQQCPNVWDDPRAISNLLQSLTENLWGIEIDAFAFHLCKLNITIHMLPLYKRFHHLSLSDDLKLARLHLFCNDTLNLYLKPERAWEHDNLWLLRSPQRLKFDYIVTNPPYMIRKTGFISEPDSELFDERVLGKGGMQAYAYFFWFCVERCKEETGEVCLISGRVRCASSKIDAQILMTKFASQWMGLEFADKLRAWLWQKCHLVEFFQFEPFKVWRKIQTDSLIFRLRRRSEPLLSNGTSLVRPSNVVDSSIRFLRYMNRKASLQETLQAYSTFDPNLNSFDKEMHYKITLPYPHTQLPSPTNSFSFTFLMPISAVSAYLDTITVNLPSLCDHSSMKPTWLERNPLIWHRGPNTNPVYALVVRTSWAYSKFGQDVCKVWLRPVFYWNGKNGGKEAEFWQKMGDELRLEKKENSPAEAYVPYLSPSYKDGSDKQEKSMYSLIMVDRDAVEKVRKEVGEDSEFWRYLKEARKHLQTGMTSREVAYCGTSKCGIDVRTKIIHPINYGYFSKNQPRQRFFIDENSVCVTNQQTTPLPPYFFLGILNSTTIQHFLSHHCKYDQQGRMRLFRENMAKIPYAAPTDGTGVDWFIRCTSKMTQVRKMLYEGISLCEDEEKVGSAVVEKLRRGAWQLIGREWQEKESDAFDDETIVLKEEQEGNWVMVKQCRGRGDEYSLYPDTGETSSSPRYNDVRTPGFRDYPSSGAAAFNDQRINTGNTRTHLMKPFFESLLHASACLQYAIDQYTYSLYGIHTEFQIALEEELKLEIFEAIITKFPRWNGANSNSVPGGVETKGAIPEWGERLLVEVEQAIEGGQLLLRQKRTTMVESGR